MKKLLTATLVLLVLAAFPGLSAAQEKKQAPDKPKGGEATLAGPQPNTVRLSETKVFPNKDCLVVAWVGNVGTNGSTWNNPGYNVNFVIVSNGKVVASKTSGKNGMTPSFLVRSGTTIRAEVPMGSAPTLKSKDDHCVEKHRIE